MKRIPPKARDAGFDADDDAWLREALHADLSRADHLDDAGFSARVVQRLPAPRLPWLDLLSALLVVVVVVIGLWPVPVSFGAALAGYAQSAGGLLSTQVTQVDTLLSRVSWSFVLGTLAPVAAPALASLLFAEA